MGKVVLGPQRFNCVMPTVLVGTNVDDKPNFLAIASCGEVCAEPPTVSVAVRHHRYSHRGIRQNMTFSINIPSEDMLRETDYCGIASGSKVNKAEICRFKVFYGKLGSAPLIEQCPLNLECRVVHILDLGSHSLFIGRIEETHITESCLTDGKPDAGKIKPFIYSMAPNRRYHALGEVIGPAFSIGRELKAGE